MKKKYFKTIAKTLLLFTFICTYNSYAQTTVTSINELVTYLNKDSVNIKMVPGTYEIGPDDVTSGLLPNANIFEFSGSNSTYDFTGVTFKFDTAIFQSYGKVEVNEIRVLGNNNVLKNLTMEDIGTVVPSKTALGIRYDGQDNLIQGFHMTIRGSTPYGYGDLFGKGSGSVISHKKHSAILIRGERNHLKGTTIIHRAYGHGIFVQGGIDSLIEDCYVEGETRTTDDVLLEEGTGTKADDVDFMTVWGYRVPAGYMFSLQEDGIRAYNNAGHYLTGELTNTRNMTVKNCTINGMRSGVTIGFCDNIKYIENCTAVGTENAFWAGSGGEVVNCKADAAYGVAYSTDYNTDSGTKVDITLIDSEYEYYGKHPLVYLGGSSHDVTINSERETTHDGGYIRVSGVRNGMRYFGDRDPKYFDQAAKNIILNNYTDNPVVLDEECNNATIVTCASVTDDGTNNTISKLYTCQESSCDLPYTRRDFEVTNRLVNHTSGPIDISCVSSAKISMDLTSVQRMETADYLNIYYQVDGGDWEVLSENVDSFSAKTVLVNGIRGNSLRLKYQAYTNVDEETYTVSNILVSEEPVSCDLPYTRRDFEVTNRLVNHTSGPIDISCVPSAKISMDLTSVQRMETADYLNIYYQVDGGDWQVLSENVDSFSAKTVSATVSGTSLRLKYQSYNNVDEETYTVSNIEVVDSSQIPAPVGATIWLKSASNNKYISADLSIHNYGPLYANRDDYKGWESFTVKDAGNNLIRLLSIATGKYVRINSDTNKIDAVGGTGDLTPLHWINNSDGTISIKANINDKYLSYNTNNEILADALSINNTEKFTYNIISQAKNINSKSSIVDKVVTLYPNPAKDAVFINYSYAESTAIEIFNISGKQVFKTSVKNAEAYNLDVNEFSAGIYLMKITNNDATYLKKFIKQ